MSSGQQDASQSVPQATQQPNHPVVIGRFPGNPQQRGPVSALLVPGVGLVAAQQQQQQYYRPRPAAAGRTRASLLMSGMENSSTMRPQEEVIFAHLHCQYGTAWGIIASQMPFQTPVSLAQRWQIITATGRCCQQLLSDYAYHIKQGKPAAAAFSEAVHRLPPGAKSQCMNGAVSEEELQQVSAAFRTAADPAKIQAIREAAKQGQVLRTEPCASTAAEHTAAPGTQLQQPVIRRGAALPPGIGSAQMLLAVQAAMRHGMQQPVAAPPSSSPPPLPTAKAAAQHANSAAAPDPGCSTAAAGAPGQVSADDKATMASAKLAEAAAVAAGGSSGSDAMASAKLAAAAYHAQKLGNGAEAEKMQELWRLGQKQQTQQQPQLQVPVTVPGSQRHVAPQLGKTGHQPMPVPGRMAPKQGIQQQTQQQQQQSGAASAAAAEAPGGQRSSPPNYQLLADSAQVIVRSGLLPSAVAEVFLSKCSTFFEKRQPVQDSPTAASAAPAQHKAEIPEPVHQAAGAVGAAVAAACSPAARAGNNGSSRPGAQAAAGPAGWAELPQRVSDGVNNASMQRLLLLQQQLQHLQQQQQQPAKPDSQGMRGSIAHDSDAGEDTSDIMRDIHGLEKAMQQLDQQASRFTGPKQQQPLLQHLHDSEDGTIHLQASPETDTSSQKPRAESPTAIAGRRSSEDSPANTACRRASADSSAGQHEVQHEVPQQGNAPANATAAHIAREASRNARYKAISQQLQQAPELVKQIKAKAVVDPEVAFSQSKQARQHSTSTQPSAHPAFTAAVKRNEGAVFAAAAEAVLGGREPRVRIAPTQFGGTKHVTSAAELQASKQGKMALLALQQLLMVPAADLPPGAHLVVEVVMPPVAQQQTQEAAGAVAAGAAAPMDVDSPAIAVKVLSVAGAAPQQKQQQQQQPGDRIGVGADEVSSRPAGTAQQGSAAVAPSAAACTPAAPASPPEKQAAAGSVATAEGSAVTAAPALPEAVKGDRSGAPAPAGVVLVHAHAGIEACLSGEAGADSNLSTGGKRRRDGADEQLQQQAGSHSEGQESAPPSAKRTYKAELFL